MRVESGNVFANPSDQITLMPAFVERSTHDGGVVPFERPSLGQVGCVEDVNLVAAYPHPVTDMLGHFGGLTLGRSVDHCDACHAGARTHDFESGECDPRPLR
jgi:hypothetical protein